MALSPEDVIKKSFSATHLRRGYDETQVDDFLDEVVVELRRLLAENDTLRTDLADCRASLGLPPGEVPDRPATPAAAEAPEDDDSAAQRERLNAELAELQAQVEARRAEAEAVEAETQDRIAAARAAAEDAASGATGEGSAEVVELRTQLESCLSTRSELEERLQEAERQVSELQSSPAATVTAADMDRSEDASSIISLAQRLHDQHVAEGESTRSRLIQEGDEYKERVVSEADARSEELVRTGHETHDRLVTEGQTRHDELVRTGQETHDRLIDEGRTRHDELVRTGEQTRDQMVTEAKEHRASVLQDLQAQQATLTGLIQDLRTQEADLRDKLRAFLSDQLQKVEAGTGA